MTEDLSTVREALELAFEETDSCIVANKCQKALAVTHRLEAAADHVPDAGKMVPELSREDVVRQSLKDALYTLQVPNVSCQAPLVKRCMCRKCVIERADAALVRSVPVGEVKPVAWGEDDQYTIDRAADLLEHYAQFINRVKPEEIEEHPYLPEIELTAADLRQIAAKVPCGKPVVWQYRMRPTWGSGTSPWGPWEECTEAQAADYKRTPFLHDWAYESRALYTTPPAPIEGWRWVPVEPTEAMEQAMADSLGACVKAYAVWADVLAAAPQPGDKT